MTKKVIGIDLGGTNIRVGRVDENGDISYRAHGPTPKAGASSDIVDSIVESIKQAIGSDSEIDTVGIAVASVLNFENPRKSEWPNLPLLEGRDLADEMEKLTGMTVILENDATAAAIGEHWLGAAKGFRNVICITLGTGVGGGIIANGEVFHGATGAAGEIGHICLDPDGPPCPCGGNGCLEQYSSGTAIVRITKELVAAFPESSLHSRLEFEAKDVYDVAKQGDRAAIKAFETAGTYLGIAIAGLVNVLNPDVVVLAGSVAASWELFIGTAEVEWQKRAFQQPRERVKIVRGVLGDDAGVLGAAKQAFGGKGFSRS